MFESEDEPAPSLVADIARMREILGEPRVDLASGIGDLA
jgi:hypothetical protein